MCLGKDVRQNRLRGGVEEGVRRSIAKCVIVSVEGQCQYGVECVVREGA